MNISLFFLYPFEQYVYAVGDETQIGILVLFDFFIKRNRFPSNNEAHLLGRNKKIKKKKLLV